MGSHTGTLDARETPVRLMDAKVCKSDVFRALELTLRLEMDPPRGLKTGRSDVNRVLEIVSIWAKTGR